MPTISFLSDPGPDQLSQIISLYRQAGWWHESAPDDPELVARIIRGSHCFLIVTLEDEIIGMGRAISDGASDAYIQDVTIKDEFRKDGLGTKVVSVLVDRLIQDHIEWIGLIAEAGSAPFYRKIGFTMMETGVPLVLVNEEV